jgi:hypothetical protein
MIRQMRVWRTGTWLYDGSVPIPVRIISLNWDPLWEEAYDSEPPYLNDQGLAYSVQFGHPPWEGAEAVYAGEVSSESQGEFAPTARLLQLDRFQFPRAVGLTVEEAVAAADALAAGGIHWASADAPAA